ncbi:MAG: hypothetical protein IJW92_08575 [Clostridia bacterium]|nr:hypothetical protein [Clostridia bacterium]
MKKTIVFLLAILLAVASCFSFVGCAAAPAVEDIYDRVVELIEASYEVNTVLYGPGLPVYQTDSEYANIKYMYYDFDEKGYYEYVTEYSKFASADQILAAAAKVYSAQYIDEVLSVALFTGYTSDDGQGGSIYGMARYLEDETWIYQSTEDNILYTAMRIYDYSTMQVISLGSSEACKVSMVSWLEDSPQETEVIELRLVLQNGEWYFDSFTGA